MGRSLSFGLATALVLAVVGCSGESGSSRSAEPDTERQRTITRTLFQALNDADVAALDELYAEDFRLWSPGTLPFSGTHTKGEALELTRSITSAFPGGLRFTIDAMTVEGDRIAVEAHSQGRHANGNDYHNRYHFLLKIRGDKIVMLKEYMDTQHAMDVLLKGMPEATAQP